MCSQWSHEVKVEHKGKLTKKSYVSCCHAVCTFCVHHKLFSLVLIPSNS